MIVWKLMSNLKLRLSWINSIKNTSFFCEYRMLDSWIHKSPQKFYRNPMTTEINWTVVASLTSISRWPKSRHICVNNSSQSKRITLFFKAHFIIQLQHVLTIHTELMSWKIIRSAENFHNVNLREICLYRHCNALHFGNKFTALCIVCVGEKITTVS